MDISSSAAGGATEHTSGRAGDAETMTLDDAITKLSAHSDLDDLGMGILAAATTLRDSTGRDRVNALRSMCRAWGVGRQEKIAGKWKNRGLPVLESLLNESVCLAAARWQPNLHRQTDQCATRIVTERMNAREAKAKRDLNATSATHAGGSSTEPPAKKACAREENHDTENIGAAIVELAFALYRLGGL